MNSIEILNVGPLKNVKLDLNQINVFMGAQSSGKSTVAKIISYCTWVEKNVAVNQSLDEYLNDTNFFRNRLESFHKLSGYFKEGSEIKFKSNVISLHYTFNSFEIDWVDQYAYKRNKISYVPAERNMVILPEIEKVEFPHNYLRSFLFDWLDARKWFNKNDVLPLLDLGIHFYCSDGQKESRISADDHDILLTNASSGVQSMTPMIAMVEYLTKYIYEGDEPLSYLLDETKKKVSENLLLTLVIKPYLDLMDGVEINSKEYNQFIKTKIVDNDPEFTKRFTEFNQIKDNLFHTCNSHLIIEEPEQNLFPETQKNLIYFLLNMIADYTHEHNLTLTTHSPYVLYAINNCIMAHLVRGKLTEDEQRELTSLSSAIDPSIISIYQIEDGTLNCIQNEDGLINEIFFDAQMKKERNIILMLDNDLYINDNRSIKIQ